MLDIKVKQKDWKIVRAGNAQRLKQSIEIAKKAAQARWSKKIFWTKIENERGVAPSQI